MIAHSLWSSVDPTVLTGKKEQRELAGALLFLSLFTWKTKKGYSGYCERPGLPVCKDNIFFPLEEITME